MRGRKFIGCLLIVSIILSSVVVPAAYAAGTTTSTVPTTLSHTSDDGKYTFKVSALNYADGILLQVDLEQTDEELLGFTMSIYGIGRSNFDNSNIAVVNGDAVSQISDSAKFVKLAGYAVVNTGGSTTPSANATLIPGKTGSVVRIFIPKTDSYDGSALENFYISPKVYLSGQSTAVSLEKSEALTISKASNENCPSDWKTMDIGSFDPVAAGNGTTATGTTYAWGYGGSITEENGTFTITPYQTTGVS